MNISKLVGLTLSNVVQDGTESITFHTTCGRSFIMNHERECCETVDIEDIAGDLSDLVGSPILQASEETNSDTPSSRYEYEGSFTWTFYKLATNKGYVTIRWYGMSNGYYSESVDFNEIIRYN